MMFMMPIPPTSREMAAMPPRKVVRMPVIEEAVESRSCWFEHGKIFLADRHVVAQAHDIGDLRVCLRNGCGAGGLDIDRIHRCAGAPDDAVAGSGERNDDLVVGTPQRRTTFRLQDTDDREGLAVDADRLPGQVGGLPKSVVARSAPMTATRAWVLTCWSLKKAPSVTCSLRMEK